MLNLIKRCERCNGQMARGYDNELSCIVAAEHRANDDPHVLAIEGALVIPCLLDRLVHRVQNHEL